MCKGGLTLSNSNGKTRTDTADIRNKIDCRGLLAKEKGLWSTEFCFVASNIKVEGVDENIRRNNPLIMQVTTAFKDINLGELQISSIRQLTASLKETRALTRSQLATVKMDKLADAVLQHPVQTAILFISVLSVILYFINTWKAIKSPLSSIPGPWYAPFTGLHLMWGFATGKIWKQAKDGHDKYGRIVRLGPRQVWISDKAAMKEILLTTDLPKVAMYAEISRDRFSPGLFGEM